MELTTTMGKLTGDVQKDMKMLMNFVFNQTEEMRYLMHNLDVTNFNDLGLARYENGRMKLFTEKLDIKTKELQIVLEDEIEGIGGWVTELELTTEGLDSTVKKQGETITANSNNINTLKTTTIPGLSSTIKQNADKIALVVKQTNGVNTINAAAIALSINNAGSLAMINADQIQMTGTTTFLSAADVGKNGTTVIDGGRIQSGTIEGVTLKSTGGTKSVTIENGGIVFPNGEIKNATGYGISLEAYTDMFIGTYKDLYLSAGGDIHIGGTNKEAVFVSSFGIQWMLGVNGWEKV